MIFPLKAGRLLKMPFKIIAISGVGRAGKDSFYKFAGDFLEEKGISFARFAFADELKKDLDPFIQEKFGFSAFTDETEKKNKIRPLMVEYGKIRRNESHGQYWLNKIKNELLSENGPQVRFVTDLRFARYGKGDELDFMISNGAKIVHVERFTEPDWLGNYEIIPPANGEEEANDPLIKKAATVRFQWHTYLPDLGNHARAEVFKLMERNPELWLNQESQE